MDTKTRLDTLNELEVEMRRLGFWKKESPQWVQQFARRSHMNEGDFMEWLQFVYLPNCLQNKYTGELSIVPQAMIYFGDDVKKGKLLQLLIELDALM